jgi:hydroxyethylthiazole kinase-like uncharacterized protein yjeF
MRANAGRASAADRFAAPIEYTSTVEHSFHARHDENEKRLARSVTKPASAEALVFDRAAARAVDRAAIEKYGIPGVVLMENAARGLADHAMRMLATSGPSTHVLIVCGSGNNGGDGYALARHLHNRGKAVLIASLGMPEPTSDAGVNRAICSQMKLTALDLDRLTKSDQIASIALIVDAIFGTGLGRDVTGPARSAIEWINSSRRPVLAVDLPSGMDCDTGRPLGACIKATATVTFLGMKQGFLNLDAQKLLGDVIVADIGAPRELLERYGRRVEAHHPNDADRMGYPPPPQRP